MKSKEWFTPPEAAADWGVHHGKVIKFIETGELKATNFASKRDGKQPRWRIHKDDLAAFVASRSNRVKPAPTQPNPRLPDRIRQYV